MMSSKSASWADITETSVAEHRPSAIDGDTEYGDYEARRRLERSLVRKIDLRMSILVVMFILNNMDRVNIAAARHRGLETDLGLEGQQYATLLAILFVGFMIMQIPSNMILNRVDKPSIYLPTAMAIWGAIDILTGITQDFVGALLTRFFLGLIESAFFPGALFLLSKWYKRDELGRRIALLFYGMYIANAFGSLIASGILNRMDGKLGQAAWRWLFYINGSLIIVMAICAMFCLPDFPSSTSWLSEEERNIALRRMEEDAGVGYQGEIGSDGGATGLWLALKDWKTWWMALLTANYNIAMSFTAYFATLSATMGFNPTVTLVLCTPPFVVTLIAAFAVSKYSDKRGERFYHISGPIFLGIIGLVIASCTMHTGARYVSFFLMAQSCAGYPVLFAWVSNSFPRPTSKRAVVFALVNAFSQLGAISGMFIWPSVWGPTYRDSYAICISTASCVIFMSYVFRQHLACLNRNLDEEEAEKGVKEKGFRYLL